MDRVGRGGGNRSVLATGIQIFLWIGTSHEELSSALRGLEQRRGCGRETAGGTTCSQGGRQGTGGGHTKVQSIGDEDDKAPILR